MAFPIYGSQPATTLGTVLTWSAGAGTVTGDLTVSRAQIVAFSPREARRWPTMAAAELIVGERVAFVPDGNGSVVFCGPWPDAA